MPVVVSIPRVVGEADSCAPVGVRRSDPIVVRVRITSVPEAVAVGNQPDLRRRRRGNCRDRGNAVTVGVLRGFVSEFLI